MPSNALTVCRGLRLSIGGRIPSWNAPITGETQRSESEPMTTHTATCEACSGTRSLHDDESGRPLLDSQGHQVWCPWCTSTDD